MAACGSAAKPTPTPPEIADTTSAAPEVVTPAVVARQDFAVGESPMSLIAHRGTLYWTDSYGSIWSMPSDGTGTPKQLSDHKSPTWKDGQLVKMLRSFGIETNFLERQWIVQRGISS